jgi:hypothetical protein
MQNDVEIEEKGNHMMEKIVTHLQQFVRAEKIGYNKSKRPTTLIVMET